MTDFWVCANCRSLNRGRSKACYSCHAPYAPYDPATGSATAPSASGAVPAVGSGSGAAPAAAPGGGFAAGATSAGLAAQFPPPPTPIPTGPSIAPSDGLGLPGGVIGGATGAILATVVWYAVVTATHVQAGIVAVAVGWIIGQAVVLGAGRATISLVPVSVAWTLLALVVSQYLITVQFINDVLVDTQAGYQIGIVASPIDALAMVGDWIQFDPLTLLFWAIALFEAVVIPWRRATRPSTARWGGRPGAAPLMMSGPMMAPLAAAGTDAPASMPAAGVEPTGTGLEAGAPPSQAASGTPS